MNRREWRMMRRGKRRRGGRCVWHLWRRDERRRESRRGGRRGQGGGRHTKRSSRGRGRRGGRRGVGVVRAFVLLIASVSISLFRLQGERRQRFVSRFDSVYGLI